MITIAHRGASADRPENTLAAFDAALEQGADWIETDLRLTRDGVIVLLHDAELERIGGHGLVGDTDWSDLQRLDAGGGERVPSLETALDHVGQAAGWNLEIKTGPSGRYPALEAESLRAVGARGLADAVVWSSFDNGVLETLHRLEPHARLGVLVSSRWGGLGVASGLRRATALGAVSLHPPVATATSRRVARAHGVGVAVYPYTTDDPAEWQRLLAAGVDGIFTNRPGAFREYLRTGAAQLDPAQAASPHQ